MAKFKNRLFGQEVSRDIIDVFKKLGAGNKLTEPLQSTNAYQEYLGESTAFTRMWTAVDNVTRTKDPDTKKMVEDHDIRVYTVNHNDELNNYGGAALASIQSQGEGGKSVTYVPQLLNSGKADNPNQLFKPAAGITSVDVKTEGSIGATFLVSIDFIVHDKHDFDNIFLPFFLRPGSNICLDIGRSYNDSGFTLYDPIELVKLSDNNLSHLDDFLFNEEIGLIAKYFGYYQPFVGLVSNYDFSVNHEGSFECKVEIVSRNHGLVDKDITQDNDLKYIFNNIFDQILREVLVAHSSETGKANIDEYFEPNARRIYNEVEFKEVINNFFRSSTINSTGNAQLGVDAYASNLGRISSIARRTGIFHQSFSGFNYNEELKKTYDDKESTYITLGKLEDVFFNPFVSAVIKEENKSKIKYGDYDLKFDSSKGRLRWEELLSALQTADLHPNEDLPSFMLPISWTDSYDTELKALDQRFKAKTENSENQQQSTPKILTHAELEGVATMDMSGVIDSETDPPSTDEVNDMFNKMDKQTYESSTLGADIKDDSVFPGIKTMPIRELFISTQLIKDAFRENDSVTKAIDQILETINNDSNNCWNIKMITVDKSGTNFCFHDVNLHAQQPRLIFDVTTGDSIVSKCDISFEKDTRLSDKLSVQAMSEPEYIDNHRLGTLSHLNALIDSKLEFSYYRSLPFLGNMNTSENKISELTLFDGEHLKKSIDKIRKESTVGKIISEEDLQKFKEEKKQAILDKKISNVVVDGTFLNDTMGKQSVNEPGVLDNVKLVNTDTMDLPVSQGGSARNFFSIDNLVLEEDGTFSPMTGYEVKVEGTEDTYGPSIKPPPPVKKTVREAILYNLRRKIHGESKSHSVPVVLPIKLQLTVYGNNYLQIGDHFTINYLPEQYKNRTLFQIVGIEQKVEPNNWSTTYSSVMKLDPKFKYLTTGAKPEEVLDSATLDPEKNDIGENKPEVPVKKVAKVITERERGDTQQQRLFKMSREVIEDSYDSSLDVAPMDAELLEDVDVGEFDVDALFAESNVVLDAPPPPPIVKPKPKPVPKPQPRGVLKMYKNDQIIGDPLKFKIYTQTKFPLMVKGDDISDFSKVTHNHETYQIKDITKLEKAENLAYALTLKWVIFHKLFGKLDLNQENFDPHDINLHFDPEILEQPDYDRANYDKPDNQVTCYIKPYSYQEMADIFNLDSNPDHLGQENRGKKIINTNNVMRFKFTPPGDSRDKSFTDFKNLIGDGGKRTILTFDRTEKKHKVGQDNIGDISTNMLIKSFTFCARNLEEGDTMYYFKLQNSNQINLFDKDNFGIPKYLFDLSETSPEDFIKELNYVYKRYLRELVKKKKSDKPKSKVTPFVTLKFFGIMSDGEPQQYSYTSKDGKFNGLVLVRTPTPKIKESGIDAMNPNWLEKYSNPQTLKFTRYQWFTYETGLFRKKTNLVVAVTPRFFMNKDVVDNLGPGPYQGFNSKTVPRIRSGAGALSVTLQPFFAEKLNYNPYDPDNWQDVAAQQKVFLALFNNCVNQALPEIHRLFVSGQSKPPKFHFTTLEGAHLKFPEKNRQL